MERSYYQQERMNIILDMLKSERSLSIAFLSDYFHVSGATIRSDLSKMERDGLVTRTHGGVMPNSRNVVFELPMSERKNQDKKERLSAYAVDMIQNGSSILIDTGTTMTALAKAIIAKPLQNLTIYSNDIDVIRILEENTTYQLFLLGGKVRNRFHYCCDNMLIRALQNLRFDQLFLAASAISVDFGLSTSDIDLAHYKQSIISIAGKVILLADSTKAGLCHLHRFAHLSDIDTLVMDDEVPTEYKEKLRNNIKETIFC